MAARRIRCHFAVLGIVVPMVLLGVVPASAEPVFPGVIHLPQGFTPEGIAIGTGTEFFTGSLVTGHIYKGDLRTGKGSVLTDGSSFGPEARVAVGMAHDRRSDALFVAGADTGKGYVYDADTGETIQVLDLADAATPFVNDVVVTRTAAFFSDSFEPVVYRVPLTSRGLPTGDVDVLPLGSDFTTAPGSFNGNGIVATPDGTALLLVSFATGQLYKVDPTTGRAIEVDLGGDSMPFGDGLVLIGKRLYAVQNLLDTISVWKLSPDLSSASREKDLRSPDFDVPATAAAFGDRLYAVNARFRDWLFPPDGTEPADPTTLDFQIVQVRR